MSSQKTLQSKVNNAQIWAYAIAVWPLVVGQMPLVFIIPYYSQVIGLNLGLVSSLLMAGRIFDMFADTAVAYASDRFSTRFGRRRPWVVAGLALFIPSLWFLFIPYPSMSTTRYAVATFVFFLTWTIAFIPYLSQGTELSTDHNQRSKINIVQSFMMLLGLLLGYIVPFLLVDKRTFSLRVSAASGLSHLHVPLFNSLASLLERAPALGVASYGQTMLIIVIMCTVIGPIALAGYMWLVPDGSARSESGAGALVHALKNGAFQRFCSGYTLMMIGYMGRSGVFPFLLIFWFKRADLLLVLVLTQYITSICATPIWSWLFKRLERKTCIIAAAFIEVAALCLLMVTPPGSDLMLIVCYVLIGLPGQTLLMVSYLIAADSADYSKWRNRSESRAVHTSIISLIVKVGNVAATGSVVLAAGLGFNPMLKAQPSSMIELLKVLGFYLPVGFILVGAAIVMTYPITRRRQAAIQRRLDRRLSAAPVGFVIASTSDPLPVDRLSALEG